jgi:hypothetical protein
MPAASVTAIRGGEDGPAAMPGQDESGLCQSRSVMAAQYGGHGKEGEYGAGHGGSACDKDSVRLCAAVMSPSR